jgi:hypothetical protein
MPYTLFYTEFIRNDNTKYEVQPHDELIREKEKTAGCDRTSRSTDE